MIALHRAWPFIVVAVLIALLTLPLSGCIGHRYDQFERERPVADK